ncbi:MAG: heme lyase CcmF/NrfE family subunit [Gemmatimonadales bacterium]
MAVVALEYLLITSDFNIAYVANYSNRDLNIFYKAAALWGGQAGSLLFWTWIVTMYGAILAFMNRHRPGKLTPYALGVLSITTFFFLVVNKFGSNPFMELNLQHADGSITPFSAPDGRGLNPLLQHPAMVIHPPMLYLGYVGFVVPFSLCMAALLTRDLGNVWIKMTRRWTLTAWLFLGTGILLGGKWAYVELGWGGYWAWDPVENASLMPWLTGTAFLHSVIVQERKNMLKVWNVVLILATYALAVFGTFLTRSGIVSSVHAFAQSNIGYYFLPFLVVMGIFALYLLFTRLEFLKSDNELDSYASREASFLFNNLILLAACFAVFWGTLFPVISELVQGEQIKVGAPFFNKVNVPIGLFLLLLTGIGPLLAWRKTSFASMKRIFLWPAVVGIVAAVIVMATLTRSIYPVMSIALSAFVVATLVAEFWRAGRARMRNTGENFLLAVGRVTSINKRRYGGYIVHFAMVLLFIGFTGQAFTVEGWGEVVPGESFTVGHYEFRCDQLLDIEDPNYDGMAAEMTVLRNGKEVAHLKPEKRFYLASEQTTSEVRIETGPVEDIYVVFAGINEDTDKAIIQVWINPLVYWVWVGALLMVVGTIFTILPNRRERRLVRGKSQVERMLRTAETVR